MAKKKVAKARTRRKKPKAPPKLRPVFGFWYPAEDDIVLIVKDFKTDHIISDDCEDGEWGE